MDYWNADMFGKSRGTPQMFHQIVENIRNFGNQIQDDSCDFGVNYIITRENHDTLIQAYEFLSQFKFNNLRFSPLWTPDFYSYHEPINEKVIEQLKILRSLKSSFVYDTYKIAQSVNNRNYSRCYFQQIVPVIGADLKIYTCHNKAYDPEGVIGSIADKTFSDVWFSPETKEFFQNFHPNHLCKHQCANDQKNIYINELINCHGDNYV